MAMTAKTVYKDGFGPLAPEVYRGRATPSTRSRLSLQTGREARTVACVVLEPVQGEGGFIPMPEEFPQQLQASSATARNPLRRRRGPVGRRPHRSGLGDRALRRRARSARQRQVDRRRPAARRRHGQGGADGRRPARRPRRNFGGNPLACAAAIAVLNEVRTPEFREPRRGARQAHPRAARERSRVSARSAASARCSQSSSPRRRRNTATRVTAAARERGLVLLSCGTVRKRDPHPRAALDRRTTLLERGLDSWRSRLATQRCLTRAARGDDPPVADVRLVGVRKTYGDVVASTASSLDVVAGEFFTMLGPSGSGKTTTCA